MSYVVNGNNQSENMNPATLNAVLSALRFLQLFSFIYSFVSFCYWALVTLDVNMPVFIRFFLEMPYVFVRIFGYIPRGTTTDFTGAIIGSFFLILGFFVNYIADSLEHMIATMPAPAPKKTAPKTISVSASSRSSASTANSSVKFSSNISTIEIAAKKFIFLLEVKISEVNIAVKSSNVDAEKLKKRIYDAIIDNLNMNKLEQCGFYKKNLFIVYKDFEYIDNFIYYIKVTLDSLAKEFSTPQIIIDFNVTFSVISQLTQLENELMIMDMISNLNMMNEFITTTKFKTAYENQDRTRYALATKGVYNLSRNLSVNNNQDLYSIREKHL